MFGALPEEEKDALRTTYFAPLLLIDLIATISTLVVEIFNRHLSDMKMWRFPKKKNTYGLKEIDGDLKHAKLESHHDAVLRLNLLKIILSFLLPNKGKNVEVKYVDLVDDLVEFNRFPWAMKASESDMQQELVQEAMRSHIETPTIDGTPTFGIVPVVDAPTIGNSSSATEIRIIVVKWKKGDEKDDEDEKDDDDEKDGEEKDKFVEEEQPQVAEEEEVQETMEVAEVTKIEVVFFSQEKDVDEAYQTSVDQTTAVSVEEQSKEELVLMESEVYTTLKKRHKLTDEDITERSTKFAIQMNLLHGHLEKLIPGVLFESFIERPISQDEKNQVSHVWSMRKDKLSPEAKVINVYIKALIKYYDSQHRIRPTKEKIVLTNVYSCQIIVLRCFDRGDLKVMNSKLILLPWNLNVNHWVLCVVSFKGRKICIYDSLVDVKIVNAQKKMKLSPRHQRIHDQLSAILPNFLIWTDFADRRLRAGSEVKT
ncbi:hypothetical protein GIB67_006891 [Kingdonia uniflora]|uniref:Ubiquitin-like protease family profile domain-containing protein n=1 Tax=Kingdonia uniflora TaxID=39325 RepID=A0A7J7L071_9MAGN|nr:hypothetical protein GIB67_006891 [Kingdonia uniflora]